VNLCDGESWQSEVVGEKLQPFIGFHIAVGHPTQRVRIGCSRLCRGQNNSLIGTYTCGFIRPLRIASLPQGVLAATRDEESGTARETMESLEINVAAIHHIESPGFGN